VLIATTAETLNTALPSRMLDRGTKSSVRELRDALVSDAGAIWQHSDDV
jgi:hypothetical protein